MPHDTTTCGGPRTCRICRGWLNESPAQMAARYARENTERRQRACGHEPCAPPPRRTLANGLEVLDAPDPYEAALRRRPGLRALEVLGDEHGVPDPYASALARRTAQEDAPETFATQYRAEREREFAESRAQTEVFRAAQPAPRALSAAELKKFEAPDGYQTALAKLKEGRK